MKKIEIKELLNRSNRHLENISSNFEAGVWELNLETQDIWRTLHHDKIFGYSKLLDKWTFDLLLKHVIPIDIEMVKESLNEAISNNKDWNIEFRIKKVDSSIRWVSLKGSCEILNDSKKVFGIIRDITKHKIAEIQLKESEERFRTISENAPVLINSFDANGNCLFWNKYCSKTFGWTFEELKKHKSPLKLFYPEHEEYLRAINNLDHGIDGVYRESSPITKDGKKLRTLWANFELPNGQIFSMGHNITELKKTEEELNKSKKLLETSQSIAKVGGWELDIKSNQLFWTKETYFLYDTSPNEFNPTIDSFISFYLPDSRKILSKALEGAINDGFGFDLELDTNTLKDRLIQVRVTCNISFENGKPAILTGIFQDITEQKKMAIEKENLAKFPSENPNPVLRLSSNGKILYANKAAEIILKFWNVSTNSYVPQKWLRIVKEAKLSENNINIKEDIYDKKYMFSVTNVIGEKYLNLYARDITEQHMAEESLLKLKTAIEKSEVIIMITNQVGEVEYTNPYFTKLTGYKSEDVLGKNPKLLKTDFHNANFYKEMWDTIKSGRTWEGEFCNKKKNGDLYWEKAIISPIHNENKIITNYVAIKTDISEDKKIEEQLRQSQKMEAIGQLAGGIAHDFNNILTGIIGCSEIIYTKVSDDKELSHFINLILETSMQAAELTQKLLSFSRKAENVHKAFNIHDSIMQTCSILESSIDKSINIIVNLEAQNSTINGDKSLIENSLLNLGINARDVMPKGGELKFTTRNVTFKNLNKLPNMPRGHGEYIEIDVQDTGYGMSKEVKEHLFEPFFTTKTIGNGTGLGLSIVYNTIKDNNGFINISSEIGHGSIFKIFLPVTSEILVEQNFEQDIVQGNGTILVAEDESIVRLVIAQMLRELGYDVITVANGEECIKSYEDKGADIDLVILDMIMPKMNGKDTFYKLKSLNNDIKAIICSGFSKDVNIKKLIENGLSGFIQKPFKKNELSKKLYSILKHSMENK